MMKEKNKSSGSEILLYSTEDGKAKIEVRLENETVWLSQSQMVDLFQTTKQIISLHIRNIFKERELQEDSVIKEYLTTASDMKDYKTKFYNLDVIISVGYRVKSHRGTQFRIWATKSTTATQNDFLLQTLLQKPQISIPERDKGDHKVRNASN